MNEAGRRNDRQYLQVAQGLRNGADIVCAAVIKYKDLETTAIGLENNRGTACAVTVLCERGNQYVMGCDAVYSGCLYVY
jgi:hypothetical protein